MTLKNINVLVLLFFLIINTIKGDCEACCEDCCKDCVKKESEDINAEENESNKGEESYEEKSKKKSNNSPQNNFFMGNNNQDNNQYNNLNNNLLPQNNFQNNFQYNFQNNAPQNNRFITGKTLGLQNVGATCYMNATLQCLFHIKELSLYFLNWYYPGFGFGSYFCNPFYLSNVLNGKPLFAQYMNLLCQVFYPEFNGNLNKDYAPQAFKDTISALNPLFQGIQANDAKDLLQCLLENLHNELKMSTQYFQEYRFDQKNELQTFQYFYNSFITQNKSPILDILYGLNKIESTCLNCKKTIYNFQSYNLLYFPLKEAKRVAVLNKKKEDKNFDEKNYILNLEDCFAHSEQVDHFTGDNQMYCNECQSSADAEYQTVLYTTPTIISIVLNRGKANLDFQEKFEFGLDLDIKKYIYSPDIKHGKYYLIGMVVHSGESSMNGHFIAYCRMDKNADWYCYNDAFVDPVDNIEEKFKVNKPYILFYHYDNDI